MYNHELKTVRVQELFPVLNRNGGAGWSLLWRMLYCSRMIKYVPIKSFKEIKTTFNKISTKSKLKILCDLGYMKEHNKVFTVTDKILPTLKQAGLNTAILPAEPDGKGDVNELHNTATFIDCLLLPDFGGLLYPEWKYEIGLIPDALLVRKIENAWSTS